MTCPDCTHQRVTLADGTETCTWSEAWRHECEARQVCDLPTIFERREYLVKIQQRRGDQAWLQLRATISVLWMSKQAQPAVAR